MYEIEKNVPMPKTATPTNYPWREMEVGDSFFVPHGSGPQANSLRTRASLIGGKLGRKFITRKIDGGVRVWRKE